MPSAPNDIVKRPLITEKSTWEGSARNRYSFEVAMLATKTEIKDAVAKLYNVRVVNVRTQVRKGQYTKTRFGLTQDRHFKKAVVELHPDDKIELL